MINQKRIVPVTRTDLLTLYGNILTLQGDSVIAVQASDIGVFSLEDADSVVYIAAEPVKTFDFASFAESESTPEVNLFFMAAYDYEGFSIAGEAVTTEGDEVDPDGCTLYIATCNTSAINISKVGF